MMLPTTFAEADDSIKYFRENEVPVVMRRIRPARAKDHPDSVLDDKGRLIEGPIAQPFYDGVTTQLIRNGQPVYDGDAGYYSEDEIKYLENNGV